MYLGDAGIADRERREILLVITAPQIDPINQSFCIGYMPSVLASVQPRTKFAATIVSFVTTMVLVRFFQRINEVVAFNEG